MPFKFSHVCDLLSKIERLKTRDPPLLQKELNAETRRVIDYWFREHRRELDNITTDGVAFLSTLFPERRTDRVYGFQEARLAPLIGRCMYMPSAKVKILHGYKTPGNGDLGACVERALQDSDCEPKPGASVTVEEVDHALQELASRCRFSGPEVRSTPSTSEPLAILERIYLRLKSPEAKWFTRLLLKDFSPVIFPWKIVLENYHFLLPGLVNFQDNFATAITLLRGPLRCYHADPDETSRRLFKQEAAKLLFPKIGVKVGRPPFWKARSIANCAQMAGSRKWSVERKYDGEYCEIHIDLCKRPHCIQIFSKSGKDSTQDRQAAHQIIMEAFRIGQPDCIFRQRCIALGELVVYSDLEQKILEFHKIRKHVSRSGSFLGTDLDSQAHDYEHLMIIFFDVLLIDDEIVMGKPYTDRREALSKLVKKRPGYAMTSERKIVDFARSDAMEVIRYEFAASLACRTEGLVLKPADMPYFSFDTFEDGDARNYFIKLKKDYIQELGQERDVTDFAVVGASYDSQQALRSGLSGLQFTHFNIGCVRNSDEVRFGRKPVYEVVGRVGDDKTCPKPALQALNDYGRFQCKPFERSGSGLCNPEEFDLSLDQTSNMSVVFREPCVVEVLGSGFEKPGNKSYFMLRHPRILKVHLDRSWRDAVTLDELKEMAEKARSAPVDGESQEMMRWIEKLKGKVERSVERKRMATTTTPRHEAIASPGSLRRKRRIESSSPDCPTPSKRNKRSPTPLVRIDTAERIRDGMPQVSQEELPLQPTRPLVNNQFPTLISSAEGLASQSKVVETTGQLQSSSDFNCKRHSGGAPEISHPLKERRRTAEFSPTRQKSSIHSLKRCPTCGKYEGLEAFRRSREPLEEITDQLP